MKPIRRILFAVKNPSAARQPGIDKAIHIAKAFGASLELFHALTSPVFLNVEPVTGETLGKLRDKSVEHARTRLAKFAAPARKRGVALECAVEWDYPAHEAVVRRAARIGADLIIAECHRGSRATSWLIHLTDWEILRNCAQPVLLLKSGKPYRRPLTLAAVDPGHRHAKPASLDSSILAWAQQVSDGLDGALHVMHVNDPSSVAMALALGDPSINADVLTLTCEDIHRQAGKAFDEFLDDKEIPRSRTHLIDGSPALAIPRLARKLSAGLVVMGAVSRSGLKRIFIGNTAERVLNALPCDVLVVKPEGFETRVESKSRGMRIVAPAATPLVA